MITRAAQIGIVALACAVSPAMAVEHSETVKRTFQLVDLDGRRSLVVDNVTGSVVVEGTSGDTIELVIQEHYEARTSADLDLARREVLLEVEERPGELELVQGGPWRCRDSRHDGNGRRRNNCRCDDNDRNYEVRFDWTLKVPKDLDLDVRSVNDGAVRVTGVGGRLVVRHVNDDVTLDRVSGQVDANTVNGELKVDFAAKPEAECRFGTVNGDIDLAFPCGFGADLSFATMNGEVFTDFPFTLAKLKSTAERTTEGNRHRHGLGRTTNATINGGGIPLDCSSINGSIYIRERLSSRGK